MPPTLFKRGDPIEIVTDDRTVSGHIALASPNGISLVLVFEAMIGGHVGMMPVMHDDGDRYHSIIDNQPVRVRKDEDDD